MADKVIITNVPFDPMTEEIAGSMIMWWGRDLNKVRDEFSQAAATQGYRKVASVEIKITVYPDKYGGPFHYFMIGTPVRPLGREGDAEC